MIFTTDPLAHRTTFEYDMVGNLTTTTNSRAATSRFSLDSPNRVTQIADALTGLTTITSDPNGNLLTVTDPGGSVTSDTYDSMDRLVTHTDPLLQAESFQYDPGGNLTQVNDRKGQVTTFSDDALGRATQAAFADASTISYSYNAGDRLTQVVDSVSGSITRTYDPLDRLLCETAPQGTVSYTYDASGRRTSLTVAGEPAVPYILDRANRLTGITQGTASVSLTYNAGGQLTGLTYRQGTAVLGTLAYSYDGAGSRSQVGGTWARTGIPQPVASATYDAANQLLTWGPQPNPFQFTARENDGAGLYFYRMRNYRPSLGRFLSEDPLGLGGGLNLYAYVGNAPTQFVDPFGLRCLSPTEGQEVVDKAEQWANKGVPYRKIGAASSREGADCSGSVKKIYGEEGRPYPYKGTSDVGSTRGGGRFVPVPTPQPGDVALFPGHLGIYDPNGPVGKRGALTILSAQFRARRFQYGHPGDFGGNPRYFRYDTPDNPGMNCP